MIRSMTGFGAGTVDVRSARIVVEIRGVNQRHLDVRVNAVRELTSVEPVVREMVRGRVDRGRVEVSLQRQVQGDRRRFEVTVREDVGAAYVEAAKRAGRAWGLENDLGVADVLRLPDVVEVKDAARDAGEEIEAARAAVGMALDAFERERVREGRQLLRAMRAQLVVVRRATTRLRRAVPAMQRALRARMLERARRLTQDMDVDAGRLAYEIASLVDRGDITEELVRLGSHLEAIGDALDAGGPTGKRVEFLLQEVLRELNTSGAKVTDPALTRWVVAGKEAVEKLREQVQNVE